MKDNTEAVFTYFIVLLLVVLGVDVESKSKLVEL